MNIWEALSAFLLSGIKLLFTPMGFAAANVFPLWEIAMVCAAGGVFGAVIFYFVGKGLNSIGSKKKKSNKKVFTKQNRRIISIKNKFGLFGTAMTIGIISVPLGAMLVGKYFSKNNLAIPSLISASLLWSFLITYSTALVVRLIVPYFSSI